MAESGVLLDQEHFTCVFCLDLLKDPVTIPCGHNYCLNCIKDYWDRNNRAGGFSCPQCRRTFTRRPALGRNTMLAEVVEKMKKTGVQAAPSAHCYAGPGDVACDSCTGRKRKATKSCLCCLASYCETHLQPHYESPAFKKHKLEKATGSLQDKLCCHHGKLLELYCRDDQSCICDLCVKYEHSGHDTVSVAAERTDKQKQLGATKSKLQLRIQKREKDLQDVRQAVQSLMHSAQAAVEDNERILNELIRSIKRRFSKVQELIRDQEKAEVSRAEGLLERLEQEIAELRRRDAELEQLSHTEDHIHFLKSCQSLSAPPGDEESPNIKVSPCISFEAVRKSLSELKERLEEVYKADFTKISQRVVDIHILVPGTRDPTAREEFLQYYSRLTLDCSTVNNSLCLSNDKREVKHVGTIQSYPSHPQRFQNLAQVLCGEGLAGRCYWEVEWSGDNGVSIAVSYKKIPRKGQGNDCGLGWNSQSWSLDCCPTSFSFCHDNECTEISVPNSSRIGVYLDHRAGTLSFYSISDRVTLLHQVDTTFTQPLYPGFRIYDESSVKLCSL